jgi:hypothetical protein
MPSRTAELTAIETQLVRLAFERKQQAVRVAEIEFDAAIQPVMAEHGRQPNEKANIVDGAEPGRLAIVFTSPDIPASE